MNRIDFVPHGECASRDTWKMERWEEKIKYLSTCGNSGLSAIRVAAFAQVSLG